MISNADSSLDSHDHPRVLEGASSYCDTPVAFSAALCNASLRSETNLESWTPIESK
jgi:hypothetical protein